MRVVIGLLAGCTLGTQVLVAQAQIASSPADPLSQAIRSAWNGAKLNLRESAEQMPDADYNFKPPQTDSVRTFGQIVAHVAGSNYEYCSLARGEKTPFTEDAFEKSAKTKAEIVKAITDAIAYCDAVYDKLTDLSLSEVVSAPGSAAQVPRIRPLLGNITHVQEHYGNLVTYFRIKGMVPPSTARATRK